MAYQVDQPIAGLIKDLRARGASLEETLIVWAGEFGRTPFSPGLGTAATTTPTGSACSWRAAA